MHPPIPRDIIETTIAGFKNSVAKKFMKKHRKDFALNSLERSAKKLLND